jgi:hypothetical protein
MTTLPTTKKYADAREKFLARLTAREITRIRADYPNLEPASFYVMPGRVYDKVVRADKYGSRSSYCYIHRTTGDIFKGNWKGVVKPLIARGNIFGANPLEGTTEYGVVYLTGPERYKVTAK